MGPGLVRESCRNCGVDWNAYGCTVAAARLYELFDPLYMLLLEDWPSLGDCCCEFWNASADDGREWSMVIELDDCIKGGSTSAIGSAVVKDARWHAVAAMDIKCRARRRR